MDYLIHVTDMGRSGEVLIVMSGALFFSPRHYNDSSSHGPDGSHTPRESATPPVPLAVVKLKCILFIHLITVLSPVFKVL